MGVNGIRFFVLMSRHNNFITTQYITNSTNNSLYNCMTGINNVYKQQGFIVNKLYFDGEFFSLENRLAGEKITLNTSAKDEHVGDVERLICAIKGGVRGVYNNLLFSELPGCLIVELY